MRDWLPTVKVTLPIEGRVSPARAGVAEMTAVTGVLLQTSTDAALLDTALALCDHAVVKLANGSPFFARVIS